MHSEVASLVSTSLLHRAGVSRLAQYLYRPSRPSARTVLGAEPRSSAISDNESGTHPNGDLQFRHWVFGKKMTVPQRHWYERESFSCRLRSFQSVVRRLVSDSSKFSIAYFPGKGTSS